MRKYLAPLAALSAATLVAVACSDTQPTQPTRVAGSTQIQAQKGGSKARPAEISAPVQTNLIDPATHAVAGSFSGTAYLTKVLVADNGDLQGVVKVVGYATTAAGTQAVTAWDTTSLSINGHSNVKSGRKVASTAAEAPVRFLPAQAGACPVLNLDLGPLHLDLLGLVVDLNEVVLNVVAQSGGGNLLGNLLCAIVNLLDAGAIFAVIGNLINALNNLLALIGGGTPV